jgi:hypothetical protein
MKEGRYALPRYISVVGQSVHASYGTALAAVDIVTVGTNDMLVKLMRKSVIEIIDKKLTSALVIGTGCNERMVSI